MALYLGIDTSNYTTSAALFDSETGKIKQERLLLPVKEGQCGLRQSDAVFHHTQRLSGVIQTLFCGVSGQVAAIAVSSRPRNTENSYMPCFTVGFNSARILSSVLKIPLYEFSHQEGHIAAALYSAERFDLFSKSFISFHISGGTTEGLLVSPSENGGFNTHIGARTLDLNAGQVIDRVGLMLGCRFPCGKELEALALSCTAQIDPAPALKGCDCCLSGLENQCASLVSKGESKAYVAKYCLKYIENTLRKMTGALIESNKNAPIVYAGGVMSDVIIREGLSKTFDCVFAKPEFSCDNAAGIAYLAYRSDNNE